MANWLRNKSRKDICRTRTHLAVYKKEIEKPLYCSYCGKPTIKHDLHAHHLEYDTEDPNAIVWVCAQCHRDLERNEDFSNILGALMFADQNAEIDDADEWD